MPADLTPMLRVGLAGLVLASSAAADSTVHVGIHRHLHQPIYWGEPVPSRPDQSQFGRDSQDLKEANQAYYGDTIQHPENQLIGGNNSVFENPDKQQAYQNNTFAYQAHRAQYIDPNTGAQQTIIAVPQCDYHGYQSGFGAVGWSFIDDKISTYNDPNQPSLVMLTNDGENFWGGGNSFWNEFAPQFMNDAPNHGKKAWHFLMWGFDSGFVYFGDSLDEEVKHTFAANRAISIAAPVVGDTSLDATPPTVFKPQRFPWNPGGKGKGQYLGGLTTGGGTVGFSMCTWKTTARRPPRSASRRTRAIARRSR